MGRNICADRSFTRAVCNILGGSNVSHGACETSIGAYIPFHGPCEAFEAPILSPFSTFANIRKHPSPWNIRKHPPPFSTIFFIFIVILISSVILIIFIVGAPVSARASLFCRSRRWLHQPTARCGDGQAKREGHPSKRVGNLLQEDRRGEIEENVAASRPSRTKKDHGA